MLAIAHRGIISVHNAAISANAKPGKIDDGGARQKTTKKAGKTSEIRLASTHHD